MIKAEVLTHVPVLTVRPATRPQARTPRRDRRLSWNMRQLGLPPAWDITRGDPYVVVAVVDTGVDVHHPDLRGKTVGGIDVVAPGKGWVDDLGHGTLVAGVIGSRGWRIPGLAGVAPGCRLVSIKCNLHGTTHVRAEHIAAGVRAAVAKGVQVVNLSVGVVEGEEFLTQEALDDMADAIHGALEAGIAVVCAAGPAGGGYPGGAACARTRLHPCNRGLAQARAGGGAGLRAGEDPRPWPGSWSRDPHFPGLIAVGGCDSRRRASARNPAGDFLTVLAPSDGVISTRKGGDSGPFGGTSAAAPHVAGIAALIRSVRPDASPAEIRDWVVSGAVGGVANAAGALALALR